MDPDLEHINEQLALIMLATQSQLDPDQQIAFAASASAIQNEYDKAVGILANKNASVDEAKWAKDVTVDQVINRNCYVPAPWETYSGIYVDPYYLWGFRPQGFACATHASVMSCIQGKRQTPRWMEHSPTGLLGDQSTHDGNYWLVDHGETKPAPALMGVHSLSPCKDGTLFANIYTRSISRMDTGVHWLFEATDNSRLYTTGYRIDLEAGRIDVDPWSPCTEARVQQVQKVPISCWSLFESLEADLHEKLAAR